MASRPSGPGAKQGLALAGMALLAVVCCAALPLLAAFAGTVAVGIIVGVGAGVTVALGIAAFVVTRRRRRDRRE